MKVTITYAPHDILRLIEDDLEKRNISTVEDYRIFRKLVFDKISGDIVLEGRA